MTFFSERPESSGIAATVGNIADGLSKLVTQHIALARVELLDNVRSVGADLGRLVAFAPFLLVGYALCCLALAVILTPSCGRAGALLVVGGSNLLGGSAGAFFSIQRLRKKKMLAQSAEELSRSALALSETHVSKESPDGR